MAKQRKTKKLPLRPLVLIYTDGHTELNYFRLKKSSLTGRKNIKIETRIANIKSGKKFVDYAKKHISSNYERLNGGDRVYCVFDMDTANDEDIRRAISSMPRHMDLIISNPDFEFWFLLHYQYYQGRLGNREPIRKLREHERNYEKPQVKEIYDSLKDREENALKNAERLRRYHKSNGSDLHSTSTNPYTNVDEIISFINSF
ncbi:MAG: RloB family protein [Euryarchaeota archaeon]|nr:RloB family protein [Euryarchaeota archaeon]